MSSLTAVIVSSDKDSMMRSKMPTADHMICGNPSARWVADAVKKISQNMQINENIKRMIFAGYFG
ncbi:MAG: hypothetical protein Q7J78_01210, partial [Clostridiales bacterium]|nr:hypothetical protein [Clostridiales bacterium]